MNGIKSRYVINLTCVRVKGDESEFFRIDSVVGQGCIMSQWLYNMYVDAVMKGVKMEMQRMAESGDYLASCIQMTWFYVACQKKKT